MITRALGNTGLNVSAIGLGTAQLGSSHTDYAVRIVQRAIELGVTYLDVARGYRDAEIKIGLATQGQRDRVILSTKTGARDREGAWREINESLERLRTDYVDNCHLHGLRDSADIAQRLGAGGAIEAFLEAKRQGLIRHIGCTAHLASVLVEALGQFDFEVILVPMNIVERDPLRELIPLCQQKGVGVTIMKPLGTGLFPAPLALKWLLNQPIASAVPGATTLEELEENAAVGWRSPALSAEETAQIEAVRAEWEHKRCRICGLCLPCPVGIGISGTLGTDVMYDHYRTMGAASFRAFPWSREAIERDLPEREKAIAQIEACTRCGECEPKCPHGLPIVDMLQATLPTMRDMVAFYREFLG